MNRNKQKATVWAEVSLPAQASMQLPSNVERMMIQAQ